MRLSLLALVLLIAGCSDELHPTIKRVLDHETWDCSFISGFDDVAWELDHGHSADELIQAIEACKNPKYKRGDKLRVKSNSNCTFTVAMVALLYPSRGPVKDGPAYRGVENCNGLEEDFAVRRQSDLVPLKRKHKECQ